MSPSWPSFSFHANTTEPKMWTYYFKTNDKMYTVSYCKLIKIFMSKKVNKIMEEECRRTNLRPGVEPLGTGVAVDALEVVKDVAGLSVVGPLGD